jgi:DNA processing protein
MSLNVRDVLLTLSVSNGGDWTGIYKDIKAKRPISDEESKLCYQNTKANFVTICDSDYPECFKRISNPPFLLYYYGKKELLSSKYRLTVVGTRNPTIYQSDTVYNLIQEVEKLMNNEVVIVSGMAKGIDQVSMEAARNLNAPVVSVIGSGIDNPYPNENEGIYEYCLKGNGLVVSEYPALGKAKPENFLFRNRLLVGLSETVFVGGGKNRSGTSSSVRIAIENNKEIMALPCNITGDDLTNSLIADGARSVLCAKDIVECLKEKLY